jgi:hypothetical protein
MSRRAAAPKKPWADKNASRRVLSPDETWAAELEAKVVAACHPWQRQAVRDPSRRISLRVGRGGGKTTAKRARGLIKISKLHRARVVYFATTRDQAIELNWEPLKDLIDKAGERDNFELSESRLVATCKRTGSRYKMVGADDKQEIEKYRGQPFDEVQVDEGASHGPELLERLLYRIIGPRLGERNGCIVLGGTPGHILRGPFYDSTRTGSDQHRPYADRDKPEYADWAKWSSHHWTLKGVAELPNAKKLYAAQCALWAEALVEKAANGWSDDNPIWRREYLGEWASDDAQNIFRYQPHLPDGTPWNQWDPPRDALGIAKLPPEHLNYLYGYVMDLGKKDPCAINIYAIAPEDPKRFIRHVFNHEQRDLYARRIAEILIGEDAVKQMLRGDGLPDQLGGLFGVTGWPAVAVADTAVLGEMILDELANVYGIKFKPADKSPRYKYGAFEGVNGDLIDGRMQILKDSATEQQMQSLQWKADEYGNLKEDKAQANHSTDCAIYIRPELITLFGDPGPTSKSEPTYADPQRLGADGVDDLDDGGSDEFGTLLFDEGDPDRWG